MEAVYDMIEKKDWYETLTASQKMAKRKQVASLFLKEQIIEGSPPTVKEMPEMSEFTPAKHK